MPNTHWRASKQMQARARDLRRAMTPAEKKLWQRVRLGQVGGWQIRKQHAVGPFILDFFCAKAKLVIEVDGDSHVAQVEYDEKRTQWLNEQKHYRVIRFRNDEIHHNIEGVLEAIYMALEEKRKPK